MVDENSKDRGHTNEARSEFFRTIREELAGREWDRNVLINIPVWGFSGNGKTTALVTAVHYCEPAEHVLSLVQVTNTDELREIEAATEEYRGLNLAEAARATQERLDQLSRRLIDDCGWNAGTDDESVYLFGIRDVTKTLAYVMVPDLRGGSYSDFDDVARIVLGQAHACVLMIDPERYIDRGTEGRRYRNEVTGRIQDCAARNLPVAVMLTKSDIYQDTDSPADHTFKKIAFELEQHESIDAKIFRVSVIGDGVVVPEGDDLPPPGDRNPDSLIKGFVWVVSRALMRPAEQLRAVPPPVHLRALMHAEPEIDTEATPEARLVGDYSGLPGTVVCSCNSPNEEAAFLFVEDSGALGRVSVNSRKEPAMVAVGALADFNGDPSELSGAVVDGTVVVGNSTSPESLWIGTLGDRLVQTQLPTDLVAWVTLGKRRVAGVDVDGRFHSLELEGEKWTTQDYLKSFVSDADSALACVVLPGNRVLAYGAGASQCVVVGTNGKVGDRVRVVLDSELLSGESQVNSLGTIVGVLGENVLHGAAGRGKKLALGTLVGDDSVSFALARDANLVAYVSNGNRLHMAHIDSKGLQRSEAAYSPVLPDTPYRIVWTPAGDTLLVEYTDDTWSVYRPMGMRPR